MTGSDPDLIDRIAHDFADVLAPGAGDEARLDAMIERALASSAGPPTSAATAGSGAPRLVVAAVVIAVAVAVGWWWWSTASPPPDGPGPAVAAAPVVVPPAPAVIATVPDQPASPDAVVPGPASTPTPSPEPPATASHAAATAEVAVPAVRSAKGPPPAPLPSAPEATSPESADELLRAANRARRAQRYPAADELYSRLHARYPRSRAATLALVTQARMRLEHLQRPALALEGFDAYLRDDPNGTLAQEAMAGRARALTRLGRTTAAQRAWAELVERFPEAVYADRPPP